MNAAIVETTKLFFIKGAVQVFRRFSRRWCPAPGGLWQNVRAERKTVMLTPGCFFCTLGVGLTLSGRSLTSAGVFRFGHIWWGFKKKLGREPIELTHGTDIPETGIAADYPVRASMNICQNDNYRVFLTRWFTCVAMMDTTIPGDIRLRGDLDDKCVVNKISGMSGWPIVWFDKQSNMGCLVL